ncbi:MAG: hypothetical protein GKR98_14540 [Boseongicola sp.]|nr:MAG: hypothetical protein GKR98_14540 [Boseongicola sp.]
MTGLRAAVLAGLKDDKSIEQLKADVTMDAYSDWGQYDAWRELNIEGMVGYLESAGLVD